MTKKTVRRSPGATHGGLARESSQRNRTSKTIAGGSANESPYVTHFAGDPERQRAILLLPCKRWVDDLTPEQQTAVLRAVDQAFETYKARQTDADGFVTVWRHRLSIAASYFPTEQARVRAATVQPWECAPAFVRNEIDLALYLRREDACFASVCKEHGILKVYSLIALRGIASASIFSLLRMNELAVECLLDELRMKREEIQHFHEWLFDFGRKNATIKQKKTADLELARKGSSEKRKQRKADIENSLRTAAYEYCLGQRHDPAQSEVIHYLINGGFAKKAVKTKKLAARSNDSSAKGSVRLGSPDDSVLSGKTIARKIAGAMQKAKKAKAALRSRSSEDLYATSHRRKR